MFNLLPEMVLFINRVRKSLAKKILTLILACTEFGTNLYLFKQVFCFLKSDKVNLISDNYPCVCRDLTLVELLSISLLDFIFAPYIQGVPKVAHHLSFIKSSNFFQT